ncbi:hypothetical protein GH714_024253 [Hevea brasiliensis]|uniref:Uncharacterized protein n=1 Tax=Hevea brasiliensis TaxID=3981 RepID=A0A6A6KS38_HEVBR|nr:hypothetical protein GH714_024253 [Hevea brasiliensis]
MCATSRRFANCLEQYKKAYTKVTPTEVIQQLNRSADYSSFHLGDGQAKEKMEIPELLCPLCRGQVKGWTVVEPARKHLNAKKRICMQDKCSFVGNYKQLRKHVKAKHPLARPRAVDPVLEEKWKKLECRHGIFNGYDYDLDEPLNDHFFPLESFNRGQSSGRYRNGFHLDFDSLDEDDYELRRPVAGGPAALSGRGLHRLTCYCHRMPQVMVATTVFALMWYSVIGKWLMILTVI